ncbi:hypothetical protein Tco_0141764 [Tanacetum coccineum]
MRTRSKARHQRQQPQQVPPHLVETPKDTMADNRTMAELLQAPTERIRGRNSGQLRYEWAPPQVTQLYSTAFTGAGAGTGDVCLSRSRALTISFNSATSRNTPEVEALVLTLATMALFRE